MSFKTIREIPSPAEIRAEIPMPKSLTEIKSKRDEELKNIFKGESNKFILVIGPCSASDESAVCDYVSRLAKLNEEVSEKLFIIPRIYTNKPRTTGEGYKGMLHQPDPLKGTDIYEGIKMIRRMHIKAINESHLTAADEMLYPENSIHAEDLLTYVAIGARSVENQQHRLVSSGLDVPVGMKNPTSGDISVMLNSIKAAQSPHGFLYRDNEVETSGNDFAHAILRGYVKSSGQNKPNYHYEDLVDLFHSYSKRELKNPAVIIDTNHANSNKNYAEQPRIAREVLNSRKSNKDIATMVKGMMIESFIEEGNQKESGTIYGKSITDGCLGFTETEKLIRYIADNV